MNTWSSTVHLESSLLPNPSQPVRSSLRKTYSCIRRLSALRFDVSSQKSPYFGNRSSNTQPIYRFESESWQSHPTGASLPLKNCILSNKNNAVSSTSAKGLCNSLSSYWMAWWSKATLYSREKTSRFPNCENIQATRPGGLATIESY